MTKQQWRRALPIFLTFLKFGCFTFGGGWNIIAQIQKEYVDKKHWITDEELLDFTSVGRSIPGIMVGNASVLFGYQAAGVPGALAALLGIVIGVRAAVVPIIFSAMMKLFKSGIKDLFCGLIAVGAFVLCLFTNLSNVLIVLLGAVAGLAWQEVRYRRDLS